MKKMRLSAFSLIEIMIAVSVLAILASVIALQSGVIRRNSRDATRKADATTYASALSRYVAQNGSSLVKSGSKTCDPSDTDTNLTNCTGAEGMGYGQITKAGGTTDHSITYATTSIADALVKGGYLQTMATDPSVIKVGNDQLDYILVRCDASAKQVFGTSDAGFAVWTYLESDNLLKTDDRTATARACGSSATAPAQFTFGYTKGTDTEPIMAPVPKSGVENTKPYYSVSNVSFSTPTPDPGFHTTDPGVGSNNPPTLLTQPVSPVAVNTPTDISFVASDKDGDLVRYEIDQDYSGSCTFAAKDTIALTTQGVTQTKTLSWDTPGTKVFCVRAFDKPGNGSGIKKISIEVTTPTNHAPVLTANATSPVATGVASTITFNATDADGDDVKYEIDCSYDTKNLTFTPEKKFPTDGSLTAQGIGHTSTCTWDTADTYTVAIRAIDSNNATSNLVTRQVIVTAGGTPPEFPFFILSGKP